MEAVKGSNPSRSTKFLKDLQETASAQPVVGLQLESENGR